MVEAALRAEEIEYGGSKQPLEELIFEQSGVHNLREVQPIASMKGSL